MAEMLPAVLPVLVSEKSVASTLRTDSLNFTAKSTLRATADGVPTAVMLVMPAVVLKFTLASDDPLCAASSKNKLLIDNL